MGKEEVKTSLNQKQFWFSKNVMKLLQTAHAMGYQVVIGEVYRPPETAKLYAQRNAGNENSCHIYKLAVDLLLFENGVYLRETRQYLELGEWWEQSHPLARWGGRFGDGNHFSFEHEGVK